MSQNDWAEGSGSTWEDLDGDPHIQPGAEVLVGKHRAIGLWENWNTEMRQWIGKRARVNTPCSSDAGTRQVKLDLDDGSWTWRVRDLVCLRTAAGELTVEGRWLADHANYYDGDVTRENAWAVRAGILVRNPFEPCIINQRRLDMALGREPEPVKVGPFEVQPGSTLPLAGEPEKPEPLRFQTFDRAHDADECKRVSENMLAGHYSCPKCLAPTEKPEHCAACSPQSAADPFPPRARVRLVGKGDADSGADMDPRWEHIGERASIADADVAARVRLPPGWRLTRTDGGEWVAWPCSGMRRLDQEPVESVTLPDTQPERRCMLCRHAKVSMLDEPCLACEDHSRWQAPESKRTCNECGRPLDPARDRFDLDGRCSDCGFAGEKKVDAHNARARQLYREWALRGAPSDRSGEAHLGALRGWLDPVCGREHWRR